MKLLYAIQGTGNGHLSRAVDVIPELMKHGQVDILVSGTAADIKLPYKVDYQLRGLSFFAGKRGGINIPQTILKNNTKSILHDVQNLPVEKYDLVINDFEPISAWACRKTDVPCIGLGHQSAFYSRKTPRPSVKDPFGEWILKNYSPVRKHVGFHFQQFDQDIFTPVIRSEIRNAKIEKGNYYTVYLPSYDDKKLVLFFLNFPSVSWHIFSKYCKEPYHIGRISVFPVSGVGFVESIVASAGVLCGAGFETPAEILYLNKKLMVVPMKGQYEQYCNAAALKKLGVPVLKKLKKKSIPKIQRWLDEHKYFNVIYPDITEQAVNRVFEIYESEF